MACGVDGVVLVCSFECCGDHVRLVMALGLRCNLPLSLCLNVCVVVRTVCEEVRGQISPVPFFNTSPCCLTRLPSTPRVSQCPHVKAPPHVRHRSRRGTRRWHAGNKISARSRETCRLDTFGRESRPTVAQPSHCGKWLAAPAWWFIYLAPDAGRTSAHQPLSSRPSPIPCALSPDYHIFLHAPHHSAAHIEQSDHGLGFYHRACSLSPLPIRRHHLFAFEPTPIH